MDRRDFLKLSVAGVSAITLNRKAFASTAAQQGTPTATVLYTAEELVLEELLIRQTDDGFENPAEIAAGRYLLTVENASSAPQGGAGFIAPPKGESVADVQRRFEAINAFFAGLESGTPPAGDDPTAFLYETLVIGGPVVGGSGSVGQAVIDLPAGEYAIWNEDFTYSPGAITVTGELPANLPEPPSTFTITAVNVEEHFDFMLDGTPAAGKQLITFFNDSDQPHFLLLFTSPVPLSDEEWMEIDRQFAGATPQPDSNLPVLEEFGTFGSTASQSADQTLWWAVDLPAGNYGAFCYIPDPRHQGTPHGMSGMVGSFSVE